MVVDALADGAPVVALESTLITHGFADPQSVEVATASEEAVRSRGAVPATIALRGGRLLVGLGQRTLETLARVRNARKVARATVAAGLASGDWGGTTVSATMLAADAAGISAFATGGIGGVQRGALRAPGRGSSHDWMVSRSIGEACGKPVILAGGRNPENVQQAVEAVSPWGVDACTGLDLRRGKRDLAKCRLFIGRARASPER